MERWDTASLTHTSLKLDGYLTYTDRCCSQRLHVKKCMSSPSHDNGGGLCAPSFIKSNQPQTSTDHGCYPTLLLPAPQLVATLLFHKPPLKAKSNEIEQQTKPNPNQFDQPKPKPKTNPTKINKKNSRRTSLPKKSAKKIQRNHSTKWAVQPSDHQPSSCSKCAWTQPSQLLSHTYIDHMHAYPPPFTCLPTCPLASVLLPLVLAHFEKNRRKNQRNFPRPTGKTTITQTPRD